MANHGGVDHDKDRRGHQSAQGWQGQGQDLAVKFASAQFVSRAGKGRVGAGAGSVGTTHSIGAMTGARGPGSTGAASG